MQQTVKLRTVGSSAVLTLPKRLLDAMGWGEGDMLVLDAEPRTLGSGHIKVRRDGKAVKR